MLPRVLPNLGSLTVRINDRGEEAANVELNSFRRLLTLNISVLYNSCMLTTTRPLCNALDPQTKLNDLELCNTNINCSVLRALPASLQSLTLRKEFVVPDEGPTVPQKKIFLTKLTVLGNCSSCRRPAVSGFSRPTLLALVDDQLSPVSLERLCWLL